MNGKNPEALAQAYNRAKGKSLKIKELGLTPEITEDEKDGIIEALAKKKAEAVGEGKEWTEYVKGQRWYVEDLIKFAGIETPEERLDYEYEAAFANNASEDEMVDKLKDLM